MGALPEFELIADGKMANLYEQSKAVDEFFASFGYRYGLKSLDIGVDPNEVVDIIHHILNAWKSQRMAVLGTIQIAKYYRVFVRIREVFKEKYARRNLLVSSIVDDWDRYELSQRASLDRGRRRPKLFNNIAHELSWFRFPMELKRDIVRKFYWKNKEIFDKSWVAWFKDIEEVKARCTELELRCQQLHLLWDFRSQDAETQHRKLLANLHCKKKAQPEFQFAPTIEELQNFAETTCSVKQEPRPKLKTTQQEPTKDTVVGENAFGKRHRSGTSFSVASPHRTSTTLPECSFHLFACDPPRSHSVLGPSDHLTVRTPVGRARARSANCIRSVPSLKMGIETSSACSPPQKSALDPKSKAYDTRPQTTDSEALHHNSLQDGLGSCAGSPQATSLRLDSVGSPVFGSTTSSRTPSRRRSLTARCSQPDHALTRS